MAGGHHQPLFDQAVQNNLVNLCQPEYQPKCDLAQIPHVRMFPPDSYVLLVATFQGCLWEWVKKVHIHTSTYTVPGFV